MLLVRDRTLYSTMRWFGSECPRLALLCCRRFLAALGVFLLEYRETIRGSSPDQCIAFGNCEEIALAGRILEGGKATCFPGSLLLRNSLRSIMGVTRDHARERPEVCHEETDAKGASFVVCREGLRRPLWWRHPAAVGRPRRRPPDDDPDSHHKRRASVIRVVLLMARRKPRDGFWLESSGRMYNS